MILTIAEIKTLAQCAGLVLTDDSRTDAEQDEAEIAVAVCPEGGLIDTDEATVRHYAHVAYFYEYPEEGCVGLGADMSVCKLANPISNMPNGR